MILGIFSILLGILDIIAPFIIVDEIGFLIYGGKTYTEFLEDLEKLLRLYF